MLSGCHFYDVTCRKNKSHFSVYSRFFPLILICEHRDPGLSRWPTFTMRKPAKVKHCQEEKARDNQAGRWATWKQSSQSKNPQQGRPEAQPHSLPWDCWNQKPFKRKLEELKLFFTSISVQATNREVSVQNLSSTGEMTLSDIGASYRLWPLPFHLFEVKFSWSNSNVHIY